MTCHDKDSEHQEQTICQWTLQLIFRSGVLQDNDEETSIKRCSWRSPWALLPSLEFQCPHGFSGSIHVSAWFCYLSRKLHFLFVLSHKSFTSNVTLSSLSLLLLWLLMGKSPWLLRLMSTEGKKSFLLETWIPPQYQRVNLPEDCQPEMMFTLKLCP